MMTKVKLLAVGGLSLMAAACSDSDLDEVVGSIFDDPDFANEIAWVDTNNAACPAWRSGEQVTVEQSLRLPEDCAYERVTFVIKQSNIEFDCNNAVLNGLNKRQRNAYGVPYSAADAPQRVAFVVSNNESADTLRNITLKNCQVVNYGMAVDVNLALSEATQQSLRQGSPIEDQLRAQAPQAIRVSNFKIINTHGSGVYVYPYVTDFQLLDSSIKGAGGSALYLDMGTRGALISGSTFEGNGFSSYDAGDRTRSARMTDTSQREAIAVDASTQHVIRSNTFRANADGGVYLYKNCWENAADDPRSLPRTEGANQHQITNNTFIKERTGVWLAERADRDQEGFKCGDPMVYQEGNSFYYRDYAARNTLTDNQFVQNKIGVRVMDNDNTLRGNKFEASEEADIEIGSRIRQLLQNPVTNTTLNDNTLSRDDGIRYLYGAQ